jgi:hypothetical protein
MDEHGCSLLPLRSIFGLVLNSFVSGELMSYNLFLVRVERFHVHFTVLIDMQFKQSARSSQFPEHKRVVYRDGNCRKNSRSLNYHDELAEWMEFHLNFMIVTRHQLRNSTEIDGNDEMNLIKCTE